MSLILLIVILLIASVDSTTFTWKPDDIIISNSSILYSYNTSNTVFQNVDMTITSESNGLLYGDDGGHFRLVFTFVIESMGDIYGQSPCITIGSSQKTVADLILNSELKLYFTNTSNINFRDLFLSEIVGISVKKFFNSITFKTSYKINFKSNLKIMHFQAFVSPSGCSMPRTIGNWNDLMRWNPTNISIPSENDNVVIPGGSGVIVLENHVSLSKLTMKGGLLLSFKTSCPPSWKLNPMESTPNKCYKLYENSSTFADADEACSQSGYSSKIDGHLVEISSYSELDVVKSLCRATPSLASPREHGCWIGLKDISSNGNFQWLPSHSSNYRGFRNWRRFEPNNHTVTEGYSTLGELCAHLVPWQEDPLIVEQGMFEDASCFVKKPFVCQMFGKTKRFTLSVSGESYFDGGVLAGGELVLKGINTLKLIGLRDSMSVKILPPLTNSPTFNPSSSPSIISTSIPTFSPSTASPTFSPSTIYPTFAPSTLHPTFSPSTNKPTFAPSSSLPTLATFSRVPTISNAPTYSPTYSPSTLVPTSSKSPTDNPTFHPSTYSPTHTKCPSIHPTFSPSTIADALETSLGSILLEDGSILTIEGQTKIINESWIGEINGNRLAFKKILALHDYMTDAQIHLFFFDVLHMHAYLQNKFYEPSKMIDYLSLLPATMQPNVFIPSSSVMTIINPSYHISAHRENLNTSIFRSGGFDVNINAAVKIEGHIFIDENLHLNLNEGGELSQASLFVSENASEVVLGGYAFKMSTYDSFDLVLSHSRAYLGEYLNRTDQEDQIFKGVYRLIVSDNILINATSSIDRFNITTCIPYNATAQELASILSLLPIVQSRGGVTVRRYGNSQDKLFAYGFTFRIEFDSPTDFLFNSGPASISVYCFGINDPCNCADVKVTIFDSSGMPNCPVKTNGRSSGVNPKACVIPPEITVTRITTLSYTKTGGKGWIRITNGVHRLPPRSHVGIGITGGRGIVGANDINWPSLSALGTGTFVFAGTSWLSWDSANVLFMEEWEFKRGFVQQLSHVPAFEMNLQSFEIGEAASLYSASPSSNMTWISGTWTGGAIGGRMTIHIIENMTLSGANKGLRYACTLWFSDTATLIWSEGNVSLSDGANIILEGTFLVNVVGERQYFGEALLLSAPSDNSNGLTLLSRQPGRNWHGYFDANIPAELRGGWYQNPLCGGKCLDTNQFTVRGDGKVHFIMASRATFYIPLNLIGTASVYLGTGGLVELASGGICGNSVTVDMAFNTTLELSGGSFLMRYTCTIKGEGELLVSSGSHDLAYSIDAHITINGGTMVWPLTRGAGAVIKFNGGMLMKSTGRLEVQPYSTTIYIDRGVVLEDECIIQFPMIGIAAQAAPSDRQDAPDDSPRGVVNINGTMQWNGGTLRGKADFNALKELYLDGATKQIRSLAKLVNQGHAEWGSGDLIMDDNADFLNLGYLQMMHGASGFTAGNLYKGSVIPVENGGDMFASNFNSWDMDQSKLSTTEYVRLRTLFVSKAPEGWSEGEQLLNEVVPPL